MLKKLISMEITQRALLIQKEMKHLLLELRRKFYYARDQLEALIYFKHQVLVKLQK